MITLPSIQELQTAKQAVNSLRNEFPILFGKLLHTVHLTRALQFKYRYMECLLLDINPEENQPTAVHSSVLQLYKQELQTLKEDPDFPLLIQMTKEFTEIGFAKLCMLIIGAEELELLVGPSSIR